MAGDEGFSDPEPLRIEAIRHRTQVTIIAQGYLDVETSPRFRESVKEVLATAPAVDGYRREPCDVRGEKTPLRALGAQRG